MMVYRIMCTLNTLTSVYVSQNERQKQKYFCGGCLQCFSSKNILIEHKEDCLSIDGKQSVKVEEGTIEFENYFKQIPVPF